MRQLLNTVLPSNRFYLEKLRATRAKEVESLADFACLPFTTKTEVARDQQLHPPFGRNLTFPLERYTRYHQTSGTTGTPVRWLDTPESWEAMVQRWITIFRVAGVSESDRIFFAFSFGPFLGFWLAFDAASKLGATCIPTGGLSSAARVRMLLDVGATVLCCTPTYALRLAQVAAEEKIDLLKCRIRRIMVAGEPGGSVPAFRSRIESLWPGGHVFDHHGMTEVGPVTFECPARPGCLHVMESGYLAEIINPETGANLEPGQTGELVLTTLDRAGSPLLRYRTGDLVKEALGCSNGLEANSSAKAKGTQLGAEGACPCGRCEMLLEGGILGRVDDMVIVRGVNVYPAAIDDVIRTCGGVAEYQVKVMRSGAMSELAVLIEPEQDYPEEGAHLVERIQKRFHNAFALRIPVETVAPGSLPRFEMKAKRWIAS